MATLAEYEVRSRIMLGRPATTTISSGDLEEHVEEAVRRYSKDRPRTAFRDYAGDGSAFDLSLTPITEWVHGFSFPQAIEYPQGERPPVFLDMGEALLYPLDSAPTSIRLTSTTPATGETARVYFSVPWPIPTNDPAVDKIPATDFETVCHYAAYLGAEQLAGRAVPKKDPSFPAAQVFDLAAEGPNWREIARDHLKAYRVAVGADEETRPTPASGWVNWDAQSSWLYTGRTFLFRRPRR